MWFGHFYSPENPVDQCLIVPVLFFLHLETDIVNRRDNMAIV